jgi:IS605 OrfB family transposase
MKTLKTLKHYLVNQADKDLIIQCLMDYAQLENLLICLLNSSLPKEGATKEEWKRWSLLTNKVIMKAVLKGNSGGIKTQEQIKETLEHFGQSYFLQQSITHCKEKKINGHNASMLVARLKKDFQNTFTSIKKFKAGKIKNFPSFPHPKKLRSKTHFSLPFESSKYSFKKDQLYLTFFNRQFPIYFPLKGKLKEIDINNVTVGFFHSDIYINLTYHSESQVQSTSTSSLSSHSTDSSQFSSQSPTLSISTPKKSAGLDIGIKNLFALYIDDQTTSSLVYSGKQLIRQNVSSNRQLSKLKSQKAQHVTEYKWVKSKKKKGCDSEIEKIEKIEEIEKNHDNSEELIQVPIRYDNSPQYKRICKEIKQIFANRNRSFRGQFEQISSSLIGYLKNHKVNHLVISKNLSFAKQKGKIRLYKKTKQTFYQIPFGSFLNLLQRKCEETGIHVECINEAWTSKTSVLSDDVNLSQSRSSTGKTGCRGVSIEGKSHRGLYLDWIEEVVYNADVGAAANHIKVAYKSSFNYLRQCLHKICNPKRIKSTHDFNCFLRQLNSSSDPLG